VNAGVPDTVTCDAGIAFGANSGGALVCDLSLVAQTITFASGYVASLGRAADSFATNANHTAGATVYNNFVIAVTGTQTDKNYVLPLTSGGVWFLGNYTTGRFQVIGSTGTGSWIPASTEAWCHTDGTNFYCQPVGEGTNKNDVGGQGPASVIQPFNQDELQGAASTNYPVVWSMIGGVLDAGTGISDAGYGVVTNNSSWYLIYNYCPANLDAGVAIDKRVLVSAHDWSGMSDGGALNYDAGGGTGGGYYMAPNFTEFMVKLHALSLAFYPDGGAGPFVSLCAQGGVPCNVNQGTAASLAPLAIDDQHGCTSLSGTGGCVSNGTTSWAAQAVFDGGCLELQVNAGSNTTTFPWTVRGEGKETRSVYP
jgi:hypothetical protein